MNVSDLIAFIAVIAAGFAAIYRQLFGINKTLTDIKLELKDKVSHNDCKLNRTECPLWRSVDQLNSRINAMMNDGK